MTAVSDTPPRGSRRVATARPSTPVVGSRTEDEGGETTPRPSASLRRMFTPPAFMIDLQEGSPVGEYVIQSQIGEGAMGTVYTAVHPVIGKTVAIKVLKPELCANQASIERFIQEAHAVNRIGHPNIVDVFALSELPDGRAYFVMEWLRGEDLKARLARGPVTVADACEILDGIARALLAAHAKDIVHRDLKPDNVFLHQVDNGPMMVKLLDFGIAKLLRSSMKMEKTQTGNMLGTPRYVSPEQARGIDIDHRADIYSLGVIAYEMLAGRPPFQGETAMDLVVKHLSEPAPPLSQFARVPKALEKCVMRMLEKNPANRPSLDLVRVTLVDPNRRFPVLPRRISWKVPLAVAVVAAGVATGFVGWKMMRDQQPATAAATGSPAPVAKPAAPPPAAPAVAAAPAAAPVQPAPPTPTPAPPAPTTLEVTLTGAAFDAVVTVDGAPWQRTGPIAPGEHVIAVRAPGRAPIEQHVDVDAGQAFTLTIVVPPRTVARPVTRPPVKPPNTRPPPKPANDDDALLRPRSHK